MANCWQIPSLAQPVQPPPRETYGENYDRTRSRKKVGQGQVRIVGLVQPPRSETYREYYDRTRHRKKVVKGQVRIVGQNEAEEAFESGSEEYA